MLASVSSIVISSSLLFTDMSDIKQEIQFATLVKGSNGHKVEKILKSLEERLVEVERDEKRWRSEKIHNSDDIGEYLSPIRYTAKYMLYSIHHLQRNGSRHRVKVIGGYTFYNWPTKEYIYAFINREKNNEIMECYKRVIDALKEKRSGSLERSLRMAQRDEMNTVMEEKKLAGKFYIPKFVWSYENDEIKVLKKKIKERDVKLAEDIKTIRKRFEHSLKRGGYCGFCDSNIIRLKREKHKIEIKIAACKRVLEKK